MIILIISFHLISNSHSFSVAVSNLNRIVISGWYGCCRLVNSVLLRLAVTVLEPWKPERIINFRKSFQFWVDRDDVHRVLIVYVQRFHYVPYQTSQQIKMETRESEMNIEWMNATTTTTTITARISSSMPMYAIRVKHTWAPFTQHFVIVAKISFKISKYQFICLEKFPNLMADEPTVHHLAIEQQQQQFLIFVSIEKLNSKMKWAFSRFLCQMPNMAWKSMRWQSASINRDRDRHDKWMLNENDSVERTRRSAVDIHILIYWTIKWCVEWIDARLNIDACVVCFVTKLSRVSIVYEKL